MTTRRWPGRNGLDAAGHRWIGRWHVLTRHGATITTRTDKGAIRVATARCDRCGEAYDYNEARVSPRWPRRFCGQACSAAAAGDIAVSKRWDERSERAEAELRAEGVTI